jgi:predicted enzyme related to lactoylglutathione lyase
MKDFYVGKLGLEVLEDFPQVLAVRAGDIRFSFFKSSEELENQNRVQVILRTTDIESAKAAIAKAGVEIIEDVVEAPNFMKFLTIADPDNNTVYIGEYLRDTLAPL